MAETNLEIARTHTQPLSTSQPKAFADPAVLSGSSMASISHVERNEDAWFADSDACSLGVFDGVGRSRGLKTASELASEAVAKHLRDIPSDLPMNLSHQAIYQALHAGHDAILKADQGIPILTTATVAKVFENREGVSSAVVASIGNSRAYLFRNHKLHHLALEQAPRVPGLIQKDSNIIKLTLDEAVGLASASEQQPLNLRKRELVSSLIGGYSVAPVVAVTDFELLAGDKLLITSNGVHDNIENAEMETIVRKGLSAYTAVKTLIKTARQRTQDSDKNGSRPDDVTAVTLWV